MSERFADFLIIVASIISLIVFILAYMSMNPVKAESSNINEKMIRLERLYSELYTFYKSPKFHEFGYGTLGESRWQDKLNLIGKDDELKNYMESLVPESLETEFLFLKPLEPNHLWHLGRYYMNNAGQDNKDTLVIKNQFERLFKIHNSKNK